MYTSHRTRHRLTGTWAGIWTGTARTRPSGFVCMSLILQLRGQHETRCPLHPALAQGVKIGFSNQVYHRLRHSVPPSSSAPGFASAQVQYQVPHRVQHEGSASDTLSVSVPVFPLGFSIVEFLSSTHGSNFQASRIDQVALFTPKLCNGAPRGSEAGRRAKEGG